MTTTAPVAVPAARHTSAVEAPAPTRDRRFGPRVTGAVFAIGGALYSISHALNLLGSTGMNSAPHEIAAKYLFGIGALTMMASAGALLRMFRNSPTGLIGTGLLWFGMLFIALSAYSQLYILPVVGWETLGEIDERAWIPGLLAMPAVLGGPVLIAIAGLRHRVVPVPVAIAFFVATVAFLAQPAIPGSLAPIMIGTTIVFGAGYAWIGIRARRSA
ncbi:hypothetical protein [Herbiconiux sp. L3-i23]|uniref:hypothetical protein n=1 Tax=Herbiconiux sp. L3-i23 TaxID=2905871 RepID=UPI002055FD3B|nr:hypothetical protein [Herbiconiux sp. L3-i23]BDI22586.1 hypothetical protein L3i23_13620 [Herbiconiux sp. L3-i23]